MAWVRFPKLSVMYYEEDVLYAHASSIGTPIKIDVNTRLATRGRFARVCVEIDLTKPLVAKFWLDERWYSVEYEGIHTICFECGRYGHRAESCSESARVAGEAEGSKTNDTVPNLTKGLVASTTEGVGNTQSPSGNGRGRMTANSFCHGPQMIAPTTQRRPRGEQAHNKQEKSPQEVRTKSSNRFSHL